MFELWSLRNDFRRFSTVANSDCYFLHIRLSVCPRTSARIPLDGYDMIYLLNAIGLTPGGSSTVHIYT